MDQEFTPEVEKKAQQRIWTAEEKLQVLEMFNAGNAMRFIAVQFNVRVGAIAGIIRRARKGGVGSEIVKPINLKANQPTKNDKRAGGHGDALRAYNMTHKATIDGKAHRVRLHIINFEKTNVKLFELRPHHCRFPLGDPRCDDFVFCGAPKRDRVTPYCVEHCKIAFTPARIPVRR